MLELEAGATIPGWILYFINCLSILILNKCSNELLMEFNLICISITRRWNAPFCVCVWSVHVCICNVCGHMCMCMDIHVCACMWRLEYHVWVFYSIIIHLMFWDTLFHLNPELADLPCLACQLSSGIFLSLPAGCGGYRQTAMPIQRLQGTRDLILMITLAQQVPHPLSVLNFYITDCVRLDFPILRFLGSFRHFG